MPARLSKIKAALAKYEIEVKNPTRGSHWMAKKAGHRSYSIPAHKGTNTQISDHYIRALCRNFNIDFDEFVRRL